MCSPLKHINRDPKNVFTLQKNQGEEDKNNFPSHEGRAEISLEF